MDSPLCIMLHHPLFFCPDILVECLDLLVTLSPSLSFQSLNHSGEAMVKVRLCRNQLYLDQYMKRTDREAVRENYQGEGLTVPTAF